MNVKNRQQLLAIAAILALVLLVSDRLIFGPLTRTWKEHTQKIAELKRSISQGQVLLDRDRIIRDSWRQMRSHTLPPDLSAAEDEVFKAFYRWSEESQISISSIKSQWKRNAEDYMVLECRADGFGSIETIARFLYEMEKDPLALRVESVEVASRDNNGQQLSLALQVSGLLLSPEDL